MNYPRIIPVLLLKGEGLVKGINFKEHRYLGDPLNAVKIFNDKEVDELIFLDINASKEGRMISPELVERISIECYMPFSVGGGIKCLDDIQLLLKLGAEKVILNTFAVDNYDFIRDASNNFGKQSIIVSVDVKKSLFGKYNIYTLSGSKKSIISLEEHLKQLVDAGVGEIIINSIDRDGMMNGYDLELVRIVSAIVDIPLIISGGAGKIGDFKQVLTNFNVSAFAAGSMFVYFGKKKGILINYPEKGELNSMGNE